MKIELVDLNLETTVQEQAMKVQEEIQEFELSQVGKVNINEVAEEAFDVIQAMVGYLVKLGFDIKELNEKHLKKMEGRGGIMGIPAQNKYIDALIKACQDYRIEIPHDMIEEIEDSDLSVERAGEIIDELKFELGWE